MTQATVAPPRSGLDDLRDIFSGAAGYHGIVHLMNLKPVELEAGRVVFEGNPDETVQTRSRPNLHHT
jgi:hypothetical protein